MAEDEGEVIGIDVVHEDGEGEGHLDKVAHQRTEIQHIEIVVERHQVRPVSNRHLSNCFTESVEDQGALDGVQEVALADQRQRLVFEVKLVLTVDVALTHQLGSQIQSSLDVGVSISQATRRHAWLKLEQTLREAHLDFTEH